MLRLWPFFLLPALAADHDPRAAELARLRQEVDQISTDLNLKKADLNGRLRALEAQSVEIQGALRREELRLEQITQSMAVAQQRITQSGEAGVVLKPVVVEGAGQLKAAIGETLPWHREERLSAVDEILSGVEGGTLSPQDASARLWAGLEDELRLGREVSLDRQTATIGGEEQQVEVLRVGQVFLYFRTASGEVGMVQYTTQGYTWIVQNNAQFSTALQGFFDSASKNIRTGWFELPLPEVKP